MSSTGYFYQAAAASAAGEHALAPIFNREPRMLPGPSSLSGTMRNSVSTKHYQSEMWGMENPMTSTGSSDDLAFLPPIDPPFMLPAMDLHPLNFKKEEYGYSPEPTSVLDMHMAPSPGSSPSRSSVYGSPESSARSTQSFSRQQSFSSNYSDSPLSSYSYPEERRSPLAKVALFQTNAGGNGMTTSWEDCMVDPHDQGDILESLLDAGDSSDTQTTSSHSQVLLDNSRDIHDLQFASENMDLAEFEPMMMLPGADHEMLTDPICQLLNEHPRTDSLSQLVEHSHHMKFDIFQQQQQHLHHTPPHQSHTDLRSCSSGNLGSQMVKQREDFSGFHQQQQKRVLVEPEAPPQPQEETGLFLVQLLLGCAEAVEKGSYEMGRQMLSRLTSMASPFGDAMQRIAVYFGEALAEQIEMITGTTYIHTTAASSQPKSREVFNPLSLDSHVAFQAYYQVLPYVKFAHFTANQAILEAVGSDERMHVVDLDIGQGLQWPSFIQSLSVRDSNKPCHLKITGVGPDHTTLQQTGRRLCEFAASRQVTLEYHAVVETRLECLDAGVLRVHLGESLAVNCASILNHSLGNHQQRALEGVLRMVNSLNPVVVAVVETESHDNLPSCLSRFVEALHHYSALFDCLEATLGRSSTERLCIEKIHFASNIRNILAHERSPGMARHLLTESWQICFRQAGFKDLALSGYSLYQAKLLLGLYNGAYKLTGQGAALSLGWQDTPIVTVSAWTC